MSKIIKTERGWPGHFCCSKDCIFRRNTLIEKDNIRIVVSTVGMMLDPLNKNKYCEIGLNRYYETMAFHAYHEKGRYWDADTSKEITFNSPWSIDELDAEDRANNMHEAVVEEIISELKKGNTYEHKDI